MKHNDDKEYKPIDNAFTREVRSDIEANMEKFRDPVVLGEMVYRLLEERENTNRLLKNILQKLAGWHWGSPPPGDRRKNHGVRQGAWQNDGRGSPGEIQLPGQERGIREAEPPLRHEPAAETAGREEGLLLSAMKKLRKNADGKA
jgi:hypothetical protein